MGEFDKNYAKCRVVVKRGIGIKKAIVYIDGFNLYYGIHKIDPCVKWLDVKSLAESFVKQHADVELYRVKYFTSEIRRGSQAAISHRQSSHRQRGYLDALKAYCEKTDIILGSFSEPRNKTCAVCRNVIVIRKGEEKKTDVNIACEILEDCHKNEVDLVYVVSSDSDLCRPVELARSEYGKEVIIASPPNRKGIELNDSASDVFNINERRLKRCRLPKKFPKSDGGFHICPNEWLWETGP